MASSDTGIPVAAGMAAEREPDAASRRRTPRRDASLQSRMLFLVALVAVPLLAVAAATVWLSYRDDRARAELRLVDQARAMGLVVDREFARAETMLKVLSVVAVVRGNDLPGIRDEISRVAAIAGERIALVSADGTMLFYSGWRANDPAPRRGPRPAVAEAAMASGHTEISDLHIGNSSGEPVVVMCVPIPPAPGASAADRAVCAGIQADYFDAVLTEQDLPPGWVSAVLDRQIVVVARSRREREFVGTPAMPVMQAAMRAAESGAVRTSTVEGVPATIGFARAPNSGFFVAIAAPEEEFLGPLRRKLLQTLGSGAVLAGFGLCAALLFARHISASLRAVAQAAAAGTTVHHGVREISDLSEALVEATATRDRIAAEARVLVEASPIGVLRSDIHGRILAANDAFLRIIGASRAELESGTLRWDRLTPPEFRPLDAAAIEQAMREGACAPYEKEYRRRDGTRVPVLLSFAIVDKVAGHAAVFVLDITARRRMEDDLRAAVEGRELLVREADHRIKNSLQLVNSLLLLQRSKLSDAEAIGALDDAIARVNAVAEAHRALHQSGTLTTVDFSRMLTDLCRHVDQLSTRVAVQCDAACNAELDAERAIPLGLIVSEVLTNAARHAYPGDGGGTVEVALNEEDGDRLRITITDHGVGIPPDSGKAYGDKPRSLGTTVIRALVRQIGAELEQQSAPGQGTRVVIRLRRRAAGEGDAARAAAR